MEGGVVGDGRSGILPGVELHHAQAVVHFLLGGHLHGAAPAKAHLLGGDGEEVILRRQQRYRPVGAEAVIEEASLGQAVVLEGGQAHHVDHSQPVGVGVAQLQIGELRPVVEGKPADRLGVEQGRLRAVEGIVGVDAGRHLHQRELVLRVDVGVGLRLPLEENILRADIDGQRGPALREDVQRRIIF